MVPRVFKTLLKCSGPFGWSKLGGVLVNDQKCVFSFDLQGKMFLDSQIICLIISGIYTYSVDINMIEPPNLEVSFKLLAKVVESSSNGLFFTAQSGHVKSKAAPETETEP